MRRVLWFLLAVGAVVLSQTWFLMINRAGLVLILMLFVIVGGVIVLLMTAPRERGGTERFIVTPTGITRVTAKYTAGSPNMDPLLVPWGESNAVHLKRISPYWKRLRVGVQRGRSIKPVVFDAGIRCPDKDAELVVATIRSHIGNSVLSAQRARTQGPADGPGPRTAPAPPAAPGTVETPRPGPNGASQKPGEGS